MGKIKEGLWDCKYCGTKRIGGSKRECPNCGKPRDIDTFFYQNNDAEYVDEEIARNLNRNPDWVCQFCNCLNSDSDTRCKSCGASRTAENIDYFSSKNNSDNYLENIFEKDEEDDIEYYVKELFNDNSGLNDFKKTENVFMDFLKNNYIALITAIVALLTLIGLIYLIIPKNETITIQNFSWNREISIEKYQTVFENSWHLPAGARLKYSRQEYYGTERVLDHVETKTRTVTKSKVVGHEEVVVGQRDLGNGYFEDITSSRPIYQDYQETETYTENVYRDDPVYRTKYYYDIDKWLYDRSYKSSGKDHKPYWADVPELPSNERISGRDERYFIEGINRKEKVRKIGLEYGDWIEVEIGQTVKLKVPALGNAKVIE